MAETGRSAQAFLPPDGREPASLGALRALVRGLERTSAEALIAPSAGPGIRAPVCSLGDPRLDAALPGGGLMLGRMHEILASEGAAGLGLALALLARIAGHGATQPTATRGGAVLWCGRDWGPRLYGPGLAAFGLDPDRLIFARARNDAETLWAIEEALRCRALAAVAGEVAALDLTAGRRLQLAAERHGVTALVLRTLHRGDCDPARLPSAAATRWRVGPLPAPADDAPAAFMSDAARWRVELLRCRGGAPRDFVLDWDHATGDLAVAAAPSDGLGAPAHSDAAD